MSYTFYANDDAAVQVILSVFVGWRFSWKTNSRLPSITREFRVVDFSLKRLIILPDNKGGWHCKKNLAEERYGYFIIINRLAWN